MTIVRDVVRDVVSAVVRDVVRGDSVIQRYFTEFFSASSQYLSATTDITAGDYEAEALVYKPAGKAVMVFGNDSNFNSRLLIDTDGSVSFRAGAELANTFISSVGLVPDDKLSTVRVKREGSTGTITVNNETPETGTVSTLDAVINAVQRSDTVYGDGRVANLKLWDGDEATGTLIVDLAIDGDGSSNTVINAASESNNFTRVNMTTANVSEFKLTNDSWVGGELWPHGVATTTGDEGAFSIIDGAVALILNIGYKYGWTTETAGLTSGEMLLQVSGVSNAISEDGVLAGDQVSTASLVRLITAASTPNGGVDVSISVKEIMEIAE